MSASLSNHLMQFEGSIHIVLCDKLGVLSRLETLYQANIVIDPVLASFCHRVAR